MAVSFVESMQGELRDAWGRQHSIEFHVRAHATHTPQFLRTGELALSGVVHAAPWAREQAASGTLVLAPLWKKTLRYAVQFTDDEGQALLLAGQKNISWRRFTHSMTHMEVSLSRDDEVLARGTMRFDLNGILGFADTWTPFPALEAPDFATPPPQDVPFVDEMTARQKRAFEGLAYAIVEQGRHVPAMDEFSVNLALRTLHLLPRHARLLYRTALSALDVSTLPRYGKRFSQLDDAIQRRYLENMSGQSGRVSPHRRRLLSLLASPIKTAHFGRVDYQRSLGIHRPVLTMQEEAPRWKERVVAPEELEAETELEADVVVIGTGAGGAAVAAILAERGLAVALVEEGRYRGRRDFQGPTSERMERLWKHQGMTISVGNPPISIPLGKLVGGTTAINSGTCFRAPNEVLQSWQHRMGFPSDFAPENFARYYESVEQELEVGPSPRRHLGAIADLVGRGADSMGLGHAPLPRNAPGCDGQGVCIFGCPTDAKRSTNNSYVPRALKAQAHLFTGLPVTRLLMRGRRAVGIEATGNTLHGAFRRLRIKARAVVVSCGAVYSPVLLAANGIRLPALGRNLSIHPGFGAWVMCDDPMKPWEGVPQGYSVEGFEKDGIQFEGYYTPPELGSLIVSAVGAELTRWMDNHDKVGSFGFMIQDENRGRILRDLEGRALIRYDLSKESVYKLKLGTAVLAELLLRGGGKEVLAAIDGRGPIRSVREARQLVDEPIAAADFRLIGCHPLGTCRMGGSARTAVVDYEHKVFGTEGLYVVDGGSVPTSLGVNPQMTIMAFATRAAEILADKLG